MRAVACRDRSVAPRRGAAALLLGLLVALSTLVVGGPARAATPCTPDDATACLNVTVTQPGTGPAAGVAVTVEGEAGTVEATTDEAGRASVPLTAAGEYTVTVDESTLPAGTVLKDSGADPATVTVALGRSAGRIVQVVQPGETDADEGPSAGSPSATAGTGDVLAGLCAARLAQAADRPAPPWARAAQWRAAGRRGWTAVPMPSPRPSGRSAFRAVRPRPPAAAQARAPAAHGRPTTGRRRG